MVFKRFKEDIKKYWKFVIYAGKSELKNEVANSYLNWLWWIIEPLCFMFVYAFVFGIVFDANEQYFPLFIFIGITMWDFFNRMLMAAVQIMKNNKPIVSKVYIPKYMLILVKGYVNGFKMTVSFGIIILMMIFYHVTPTLQMLWIVPIILTMFVVTFAICTFLLHFGVYVDDLANVLRIVLRIIFYFTGIFYNVEKRIGARFGERIGKLLTEVNPMGSFLASARKCLLYGAMPDMKWIFLWLAAGLVLAVLGVRLIYKNENSYVKVI